MKAGSGSAPQAPDSTAAWEELRTLASGTVPPQAFWTRYVTAVLRAAQAAGVAVAVRPPGADAAWRLLASVTDASQGRGKPGESLAREALALAAAFAAKEEFPRSLNVGTDERTRHDTAWDVWAAAVPARQDGAACVLLAAVTAGAEFGPAGAALEAGALVPAAFEASQSARRAEGDVTRLSNVLDVLVLMNGQDRLLAAALGLCNGTAQHYACERVSLGWIVRGQCVLETVSRQEHFDRKMSQAQKLEAAMDECADQDVEVVWPVPADGRALAREHATYAAETKCGHLCSLPLRHENKIVGVVTCEREAGAFTTDEIEALRLVADSAAPRLALLRHNERWWGVRAVDWTKKKSSSLLGPRHTLAKLLSVLGAIALAVLIFWRTEYRVEGAFVLRSDEVSNLTAPFDGYIKQVLVEPGDAVGKGQPLLRLDTSAMKVEESAAVAEFDRYDREATKARAAKSIAEMQIAEALARQAQAKLDVIRYRLSQAEVRSTLDGVITEGDLREKLDAPVRQGDTLFRVSKLTGLRLELQLDERDAHEVASGAGGEAAFASQPADKHPIRVDLVLPAASNKEGHNVFEGRAVFQDTPAPWWRPGMSGVCKINCGERSLLWILTHRTIDFLRLHLWW